MEDIDFNSQTRKKSRRGEIWRRMKKNRIAMVGLFIFSAILLLTISADLITPYDKAITGSLADRLTPPSSSHWFGTDNYGRDIFARILHASRRSLVMGIGAVLVGITLGGLLGACAGYYGGRVDSVIMRIIDTVICIPFMLLVLAIVAALGPGLVNVLIALMISMIPTYTRVIRSAILTVVGQDYIEAAKSCGTPNRWIILKHVLPNAIGPIIVQATMTVGTMIIWAASTSFLGMGIQPPEPEWGAMLAESKDYMLTAPYMVMFPGFAIALTALSLNLMGDGLRDALDPRLKD
ncbi:MAG: ABC transporter permease [Synergistaceae bacterium]|jgi:peptide/nickel transport system permease protein|nr:ABC transporter permease [Synergistaceae bacterium]